MNDDDGRDPTMLTNPYFWGLCIVCAAIWTAVLWPVLS